MPNQNPVVNAIVTSARRQGVDPLAALAVASVEGGLNAGGRPGDSGTSFGPFQEHVRGALPRQFWGNPAAAQAWSWSPAGIAHAIRQQAQYARGKKGRAAVAAIVTGFERPADIPAEIAKASGRYGIGARAATSPDIAPISSPGGPRPGPAVQQPQGPARLALLGVLNANNEILGAPPLLLPAAQPRPNAAPVARRLTATPAVGRGSTGNPGLPAGHKRGKTIRYLEHFAAPFGLIVTSTTGGKHARGSYHYKGRAVDFGGDPVRMAALAKAALQHPQQFAELFYTGPGSPGYFIKDGRAYPNSQLDPELAAEHTNHVHLAR